MSDQDERRTRGEKDIDTATELVRELLDEFPDPETGVALAGLMTLAWDAHPHLLTTRQPQLNDGGHAGKPGSRPPTRLDLWAHVQNALDTSRQEADDLGSFTNGADGEIALRRLPDLLIRTLDDCFTCDACNHPYDQETKRCTVCRANGKPVKHVCECRHRAVVRALSWHHSELRTALQFQEPKSDRRDIVCPECGRAGKVSVRLEQQRIWCRHQDCGWERVGAFAVIAMAAA